MAFYHQSYTETTMTVLMPSDGLVHHYRELEATIHEAIRSFQRKHGGNWEDLLDQALLIFVNASQKYDRQCDAHAFVRNHTYYTLLDQYRNEKGRHGNHPKAEPLLDIYALPETFSLDALLEDLSDDAKLAIQLAINTPPELTEMVERRGGQLRNFRSCIKMYLDGMGWSRARIKRTFEEVRTAL